jgi:DNA-binding transcriptional regulator YhcF (GntR family)
MNLMKTGIPRLPGSRSFMRRSPMFRVTEHTARPSSKQLVETISESLRSGHYRPGEGFPNSRQLAELTGASPIDSLKAVTYLLKAGWVRQLTTGQLVVAKGPGGIETCSPPLVR